MGKIFFLLLVVCAHADIVWQGMRVSHWPREALPELEIVSPKGLNLKKIAPNSSGMGIYPAPQGTIWGLTMLVDFSDQPATKTIPEVEDWLNKPGFNAGGCNGSIRDYYYEASNGKVEFKNVVKGYYRAKNPKSYYDGGNGYERATELINEVLAHFQDQVDFSQFDNDGDGYTEAVSILYAGTGKNWGQGIWPHSGWLNKKRNGVTVNRYMLSDMGNDYSIYVFAHESGHMIFGWPDLYWFGDYCLMGNRMNDKNPVLINDFFRADQGWISFADVDANTNGVFKAAVNGVAYRYRNPTRPTKEGFFWSNINNKGRNKSLQGQGIIIYHYDIDRKSNSSADNLIVRLIRADNKAFGADEQWPNPGNAAKFIFNQSNQAEFSSATNSFTQWNSNTPSQIKIWDISAASDTMTFKMGTGVEPPVHSLAKVKIVNHIVPRNRDLLGRMQPQTTP